MLVVARENLWPLPLVIALTSCSFSLKSARAEGVKIGININAN